MYRYTGGINKWKRCIAVPESLEVNKCNPTIRPAKRDRREDVQRIPEKIALKGKKKYHWTEVWVLFIYSYIILFEIILII